jgi:cytochrome c-type biogenesis protein CcmF
MIPEYGHLALVLALMLSILLAVVPLAGTFTHRVLWMRASRPLAAGVFFFLLVAFVVLSWAFWHDDFSVRYVVNQSNSLLPWYYKLSAVWGGHEGSLLLWGLVLAGWMLAVAIWSKDLPLDMLARVLSVMGMISIGFLLFMLLTSNPFERVLPTIPTDGADLNPLLQDFGLIVHPPMLYMGYVGFSVAFAFAIAALLSGRLDSAWARWSRPWTNLAWVFLTLGIALGSWWAYYELGWGGWWFWDPVENASFMPWLVGTALIHSLAVTEKRGAFKSWTILLAISAFSLSLLGTFLVRSGVLTSVHAFAADPERGVFILIFLLIVVGGSLTLYAVRAPQVKSVAGSAFFSRETFLMGNNVLFVVTTIMVLLGTLYPLVSSALDWGKISVGEPYFNMMFVPLMSLVALLLGAGIMMNWKRTQLSKIKVWQLVPFALSVALGALLPLLHPQGYSTTAAVTVFLGSWVILASLSDILRKLRHSSPWWQNFGKLSLSYYGMIIAHIGFAVSLLGAGLNTIYSDQRDVRLEFGQRISVGNHQYELVGVTRARGPNYVAEVGEVHVLDDDRVVVELYPEKRRYLSGGNVMTEAGIDAGFWRDLYVALGEKLSSTAWSVRIHYKPFVRWIWLGAILMGLGATMALADKRYRARKMRTSSGSRSSAVAALDKPAPQTINETGGSQS